MHQVRIVKITSPPQGIKCLDGSEPPTPESPGVKAIAHLLETLAQGMISTEISVEMVGWQVTTTNSSHYQDAIAQTEDFWVPVLTRIAPGEFELGGFVRYRIGTCGWCGAEGEPSLGYECAVCGGS